MFTGGLIANGVRGMMCSSGGGSISSAVIDAAVATPVISTLDLGSGFVVKAHLGQIASINTVEEIYSHSTYTGNFLIVYDYQLPYDCFLVVYHGGTPIIAIRSGLFRENSRSYSSYRTEADDSTTLIYTFEANFAALEITEPLQLIMRYATNSPEFDIGFKYQTISTYVGSEPYIREQSLSYDLYPTNPRHNWGNFPALTGNAYREFQRTFHRACATYAGLLD